VIRDWLIATLLGYLERGTPKPRTAPHIAAPQRRSMRVAEAVGMSRIPRSEIGVTTTATIGASQAFSPSRPAPGIVPDGVKPMAMDDSFAWLAGQSRYTENIGWLGMPFLAELSQRAEYRQIVETIAKDMTRRWIKITAQGDEDKTGKVAAIGDALKKYQIREKFRRLAELDGFFGRGHLYVDTGRTGDREMLKVPMIFDRRTWDKLIDFRVVEPVWTYPGVYNSIDPLGEDYYAPRTWYVFGKEVHRTRLLTMVSREVPDLLKPSYQFGGISMSQLARPYIDNWLRTRQSISDLVHSFSTMVLKTEMSDILQDGGAQALWDRIDLFNSLRDNRGTMALDKNREDLVNVTTPLGTLDALQAQAQEQMAAVSHTPLIVLLGITPSGLNASSDGELQVWASWVRSMQEHLFDGPLDRVIKCIQIDLWGETDPDIGFDYEPLRELSDAELAAAQKQEADTHAVYVNAGVIAPEEVRQALAEDEGSPYAGVDLSGPPPDPPMPQMEDDPLGSPPDGPQGAPPGAASEDDAITAPDLAAGVARAIEARQAEEAYENWFHSRDE
jgi:phage-related protein (TIGR01555 family)